MRQHAQAKRELRGTIWAGTKKKEEQIKAWGMRMERTRGLLFLLLSFLLGLYSKDKIVFFSPLPLFMSELCASCAQLRLRPIKLNSSTFLASFISVSVQMELTISVDYS